jgi:hypothetical protein
MGKTPSPGAAAKDGKKTFFDREAEVLNAKAP